MCAQYSALCDTSVDAYVAYCSTFADGRTSLSFNRGLLVDADSNNFSGDFVHDYIPVVLSEAKIALLRLGDVEIEAGTVLGDCGECRRHLGSLESLRGGGLVCFLAGSFNSYRVRGFCGDTHDIPRQFVTVVSKFEPVVGSRRFSAEQSSVIGLSDNGELRRGCEVVEDQRSDSGGAGGDNIVSDGSGCADRVGFEAQESKSSVGGVGSGSDVVGFSARHCGAGDKSAVGSDSIARPGVVVGRVDSSIDDVGSVLVCAESRVPVISKTEYNRKTRQRRKAARKEKKSTGFVSAFSNCSDDVKRALQESKAKKLMVENELVRRQKECVLAATEGAKTLAEFTQVMALVDVVGTDQNEHFKFVSSFEDEVCEVPVDTGLKVTANRNSSSYVVPARRGPFDRCLTCVGCDTRCAKCEVRSQLELESLQADLEQLRLAKKNGMFSRVDKSAEQTRVERFASQRVQTVCTGPNTRPNSAVSRGSSGSGSVSPNSSVSREKGTPASSITQRSIEDELLIADLKKKNQELQESEEAMSKRLKESDASSEVIRQLRRENRAKTDRIDNLTRRLQK